MGAQEDSVETNDCGQMYSNISGDPYCWDVTYSECIQTYFSPN